MLFTDSESPASSAQGSVLSVLFGRRKGSASLASNRSSLRSVGVVMLLFVAGIATSFGFALVGLDPEASFLVFIVGILIASLETDSGLWGIGLGVAYLVAYDLFFALPHLSLLIFNWSDAVTLVIFAVVALITGTLTNRMKQQVEITERNALALRRLNKISAGLIDSTSAEGACEFSEDALNRILKCPVCIVLGNPEHADALAFAPRQGGSSDDEGEGDKLSSKAWQANNRAAQECFEQGYRTGAGISGYGACTNMYVPLSAKSHVYGVVALDCTNGDIDKSEQSFLDSVIKQTVIAVERNNLEEHARADELKIERERFKTTLLRSVSHDLRTPLASIQGNAEFLEQNFDNVSANERQALLASMSGDARWLAEMIDNLLGMTRVQDDVPLSFQPEVVDDVIGEAVAHEMPYRGQHEIAVEPSDDVVVAPMDGKLIRQVLINLIDNAIKHSAPTSLIRVSSQLESGRVVFQVADNGGGIAPRMLDKVFGRFVSGSTEAGGKSGIGLGLSICEAIIEAHGGTISARNNDEGGATFEFWLPLERPRIEEDSACAGVLADDSSLERLGELKGSSLDPSAKRRRS